MAFRRKPKSRIVAPASVIFTQAVNEKGHKQICVYAECAYGGTRVGPIWSHDVRAVKRALATLSSECGCGRKFHKQRYIEGYPIITTSH
jgi:hypothetical protein